MPLKKIRFKTTPAQQNQRLDQVLTELLPQYLNQPISKGKIRKLIIAGAVYLNGRRVRIASKSVLMNAQIEAFVDLERLNSDEKSKDSPFVMTNDRILYEDEDLIAVNKPSGLPTQPTLDNARDNLFTIVKKFLFDRSSQATGEPYLGLHHRLDRDTSGVILFTKSQRANPGIADIFQSHLAKKTYQCLANWNPTGSVPQTWTIKNFLGREKRSGKKAKYTAVRSGGDFAQTELRLIDTLKERCAWIEAKPLTGRTHQIRVHLAESGMAILGDLFYGGSNQVGNIKIPRVMLHAVNLTFPHPIHQNRISIQCPLSEDFSQCLQALQKGGTGS